jgi:hypothetical protein
VTKLFEDRRFRLLVWYVLLYQLGHLCITLGYLAGIHNFPPPPPGGWTEPTRWFTGSLAVADSSGAIAGIVFAIGYFLKRHWCFLVGLMGSSQSIGSTLFFGYYLVASQGWKTHPIEYVPMAIVTIPGILVFYWLARDFLVISSAEAKIRAEAKIQAAATPSTAQRASA